MAYTPEISKFHSAALRRIAWAAEKPMTKILASIIEAFALTLDPANICPQCSRKASTTPCKSCIFGDGQSEINESLIEKINQLKPQITSEVSMKPKQVSVLISKKIGRNFCSWSVSQGVTAELEEGDHYKEAIAELDASLKTMVATSLPTDLKAKSLPAELPSIPEVTTG